MKMSWMKSSLIAALVAVGCGTATPTQPTNGKVLLNLSANATLPKNALLSFGEMCADFTFTPYSLDAKGLATAAGAPVTFKTTASPSGTVAIAGCLDTLPNIAAAPSLPQDDWEYMVTATGFVPCSGASILPATISPSTVYTVVKLNCQKGLDVPATVTVNVSVTNTNNAGYTDIGAIVNAEEVDVGCKTPDWAQIPNADGIFSPSANIINFGESWIGAAASAPKGLWGHTAYLDASFQQYSGRAGVDPLTDQYYTGSIDNSTGTLPYLLQTFVPTCAGAQSYAGTMIPACVTLASQWSNIGVAAAAPAVTAGLIEAFEKTGTLWAAARKSESVAGGGFDSVEFVSSDTFNTIATNATPAILGNGNNNTVLVTTVTPSIEGAVIQGIYPFKGESTGTLGFVVTVLDSQSTLSWTLYERKFGDLSFSARASATAVAMTATTQSQFDCLRLYDTNDTCFDPNNCTL